jgi:hypothetical protein
MSGKEKPEPLDAPILVRATKSERIAIRKNADAAGLSLSRYLVWTGSRNTPPISIEDRVALLKLAEQLRRLGTNVNQLAHAMNASRRGNGQPPSESDIAAAARSVQELLAATKAML